MDPFTGMTGVWPLSTSVVRAEGCIIPSAWEPPADC